MVDEDDTISDDKVSKAVLIFSRRRAVSAAQLGLELGLDPSKSVYLTQHLVDEGLVSGHHGSDSTVRLDEFYSLTTQGVRTARSMKKKEVRG